jgi:predicted nucleic acid-binding Zn ribbon protein
VAGSKRGLPKWDRSGPTRRDPGDKGDEAPGLGSVLDGMLEAGPWRTGLAVGRLARGWEAVVGDRLARETAPVRLDDAGVLVVQATTAAWAVQIRFLGADIMAGANRSLGEERVRAVRVVVKEG